MPGDNSVLVQFHYELIFKVILLFGKLKLLMPKTGRLLQQHISNLSKHVESLNDEVDPAFSQPQAGVDQGTGHRKF